MRSDARKWLAVVAASLCAAACTGEPVGDRAAEDDKTQVTESRKTEVQSQGMPETSAGKIYPIGEWQTVSSGEGDGLFFETVEGDPARVHLFCPSDGGLLVNVDRFRPIGSEERMSLGSGEQVVALVVDPSSDPLRGGVSGEGPVPAELEDILTGGSGVGVSYGAQQVDPLPPVPARIAADFVRGCND